MGQYVDSMLDGACEDVRWRCKVSMLHCQQCQEQCDWGKFMVAEFEKYNRNNHLRKMQEE
jgi:hypothetical protein